MKLLFLLPLLFIAVTGNTQNHTKAVLYKADGSKIDCYVKTTSYEGTQQKFEYAFEKGGNLASMDETELTKVEFEDGMVLERHFISIININSKPIDRRKADYDNPANKTEGSFMVERLISGSYSLYQFVDKYQYAHFFYKTKNETGIERLFYTEYTNDDATIINKREFRNQVLFVATNAGCADKLGATINNMEYRFSDMVSVFKKLNACAGEETDVNKNVYGNKGVVKFSVMAGLGITTLKFDDPNPGYYPGLSDDKFSSSLSPAFGASVDFVPKKRQKNYIVSVELLYNSYSSKTDSIRYNTYTTGIGYIKFSLLNLSPVVRFRLSKTGVMPFLEGGVSLRWIVNKEDYYIVKTSTEVKRPIFSSKGTSAAAFGGAGIEFQRFSVHARYYAAISGNQTSYNHFFLIGKVSLSKNR